MIQGHLAIASVPIQEWKNVYNQCEALSVGTIFPELNMPFFAADSVGAGGKHSALKGCADIPARAGENSEGQQQKAMMRQIQEVSFVADDVRLYMDTHPEDQKGLELLQTVLAKRSMLMEEFAEKFFPLTTDCMTKIFERNPRAHCCCWKEGPMPWEGGCV